MIDFTHVKKTGLKMSGELEQIFGVSRIMIQGYLSGRVQPRGRRARRIQEAVRVLDGLVQLGKLPLPKEKTKAQREMAVSKIVAHINSKLQ